VCIARLITPCLVVLFALPASLSAFGDRLESSAMTPATIPPATGQNHDVRATARILTDGAKRAAEKIAATPYRRSTAGASASAAQQAKSSRNWFARHPVWTGVIVGAAAGTAVTAVAWGSEGSFLGFWGGAALGAGVGAVVSQ